MRRFHVLLLLLTLAACTPPGTARAPLITGKIAHVGKNGFAIDSRSSKTGSAKTAFIKMDGDDSPILKQLKKGDSITVMGYESSTPARPGKEETKETVMTEFILGNGKRIPLN